MDEVAFTIHIEPIADAFKELSERMAQLIFMVEKTGETVQRMEQKMRQYDSALETLLHRSTARSNCAFCTFEDNRDQHQTGRCCRYADPVARATQASAMRLCEKCLQPKHSEDCGLSCQICGRGHNVLLCPSRGGHSGFKRRKANSPIFLTKILRNNFNLELSQIWLIRAPR